MELLADYPLIAKYSGSDVHERLSGADVLELPALAAELRRLIISVVSKNGGHLASNLGVVELTIYLLRIFDPRHDRIIWDVGHQSYAYKILTGRAENFFDLRQDGGISGFPRREESPCDAFNTGHSSTSLSAALGMARAFKLRKEARSVVAVIGDGALSGGMAMEAMNDMGDDDDVIIIVNDNQMSISPNVGRIARDFASIRVNPYYVGLKPRIEAFVTRIPLIGRALANGLRRIKSYFRHLTQPRNCIFEGWGLRYYGPIDGHDARQLERYLSAMRNLHGPRVLQIFTQKGRGYAPAEEEPENFHGVAPFVVEPLRDMRRASGNNGNGETTRVTWADVVSDCLLEQGESDERVCVITAAMSSGTGTFEFGRRYPERFFDVGIAEQHAVTFAAGLATTGLKPIVAIYATFMQRAYDQLVHDCCLQNLPVTFLISHAGLVGGDGETHQGVLALPMLLPLPNLQVLQPQSAAALKEQLEYALNHRQGPTALIYPKGVVDNPISVLNFPNAPSGAVPAVAPRLLRAGSDMAILSSGNSLKTALRAAERISRSETQAAEIAVIDLQYLNSPDLNGLIPILAKYPRLATLEEGMLAGGMGHYVTECLRKAGLSTPVLNLGLKEYPRGIFSVDRVLRHNRLDTDGVAAEITQWLHR
ncbi:MAG: 1-deoxy-D-xylulose-5-phosphate synthase [Clostridiaceae bacterium]|nr:1-deoxy-D-xylulose-5-phosphate synthase [Clostridiaceae bacterium]